MFAGAVLAAVVTGIMVNALALQHGHHPAPFFGRSFAVPEDAPAPVAPVARAVVSDKPAVASTRASTAPAPVPAVPATAEAAPKSAGDPIGELIKGAAPKGSAPARSKREAHAAQ